MAQPTAGQRQPTLHVGKCWWPLGKCWGNTEENGGKIVENGENGGEMLGDVLEKWWTNDGKMLEISAIRWKKQGRSEIGRLFWEEHAYYA